MACCCYSSLRRCAPAYKRRVAGAEAGRCDDDEDDDDDDVGAGVLRAEMDLSCSWLSLSRQHTRSCGVTLVGALGVDCSGCGADTPAEAARASARESIAASAPVVALSAFTKGIVMYIYWSVSAL